MHRKIMEGLSFLSFVRLSFTNFLSFFCLSLTQVAVGHTDVAYSTFQENRVTLLRRGFAPAFPIYMLYYIYVFNEPECDLNELSTASASSTASGHQLVSLAKNCWTSPAPPSSPSRRECLLAFCLNDCQTDPAFSGFLQIQRMISFI